jgi:DNA polymerase-3 subunit alpha
MELLEKYKDGLICLSGCEKGPFSDLILKNEETKLTETIDKYLTLFGNDFYFEIQRHRTTQEDLELDGTVRESWLYRQYQQHVSNQKAIECALREQSVKRNIPCVATNNAHYLHRQDWKAHEVLLNIQSGEPCQIRQRDGGDHSTITPNPKRTTFPCHEYDFKSPKEMEALFSDFPECLSATATIADACSVSIDFNTKHYPVYSVPNLEGGAPQSASEYLRALCEKNITVRYTKEKLDKVAEHYPDEKPEEVVRNRLEYELDIITSKGLTDYFLLVWDFIHWAKQHDIPVGPGRGSGVGSIVLFLIGVTDIEPLRFHLFFERFINPGRLSYPDIDVDLCMERRPEVIEYTIQKYGRSNVAQIITFGTMKAKMSVRDVGRALNIPLQKVNQIAKLIPDDLNITIEKALEKDQELKALVESDEEAASIIEAAKVLEGSIRNTGLHAAGLIVCGEPLVEHIPICTAKDSDMYATQFSMKPAEQVGMLKIDFLGLKTLTSIKQCVDVINTSKGIKIDWCDIPLEDPQTFSLLNQGKTLGVFQIEDGGMQQLAQQIRLERFEEIIALLSLYRPGPMEMIPNYIARKWGREPIEYDHPLMEPILKETYGIMVYQEQIMQIAQQLADFSLSEGDVLRRAMGKKDAKEMAKQREKFVSGAAKHEISDAVATTIFDKMEKFAEYGFNKSHAAAYAYITYVTAYLKAHFPGEWLAALMTCDKDDIEKVARIMHEAQQLHILCLPPDVNESENQFTATPSGIRFALSAVKGFGSQAVQAIIEERKQNEFVSLYDFVNRVDPKRVGKKAIELLIDAGSFDRFEWHRDELLASLDAMYEQVVRTKKEQEKGIFSLFDQVGNEVPKAFQTPVKPARLRTQEELFFREKQLLGLFVSGHPLTSRQKQFANLGCVTIPQVLSMPEGTAFRMAFVVETVSVKISSKNQRKFAFLSVSDASGEVLEVPVWPDVYEAHHDIILENSVLWGVFTKEKRDDGVSYTCQWLADIHSTTPQTIEESHAAYEKSKAQLSRFHGSKGKKTAAKVEKEPKPTPITTIRFDITQFRASHSLTLSTHLSAQKGQDRVQIAFSKDQKDIAVLSLPLTEVTPAVLEFIEELPSWMETKTS